MAGTQFMKAQISLILFLSAGACLASDAYKWVDEKGVTNYGEKAPESRSAKPVSTQPSAVIETGGQFNQKSETERRRTGEIAQKSEVAVAPPPAVMPVRGMDFDVYIRLQRGMTEGELLLRAGRPDFESLDGFGAGIVKSYYYFPTTSNPYTSVVTLRGGRIFELDRIKKF